MFIGHTGTAKTYAIQCASKAMGRDLFIVNCGSSQDARSTLIGNTSYKKEIGTLFCPSPFIKAITTPKTIILLDEFSRGSHDLMNILMPTIDPIQRTIRLDEDLNGTVIHVANDVTFIATANIGNEYVATKILDKAITRRFPVKIEMLPLTKSEIERLVNIRFPDCSTSIKKTIKTLIKIYGDILDQYNIENASISNFISPANVMEMVELIIDGFTILDICQVAIYPEFSNDGGNESERKFVESIVQKHIDVSVTSPINDPLKNK